MNIKQLIKPNEELTRANNSLLICIWVFILLTVWQLSHSHVIPTPTAIIGATVDLVLHQDLIREFVKSLSMCLYAMGIATVISLVIAYMDTLPLFGPLVEFSTKLRFLPSVGLMFLFTQLTENIQQEKTVLLVFSVAVFFVTSSVSTVRQVTHKDRNYARSLRLTEWKVVLETVILGKLADIYEGIRQNFAMAWTMLAFAENIVKSEGGIGVILADNTKYSHWAEVYAIQMLILLTGIGMDYLLKKSKGWLFPYSIIN